MPGPSSPTSCTTGRSLPPPWTWARGSSSAAFGERLAFPLPPRLVDDGPVLEQTVQQVDLPALLPALTHYERDSGPFLTSGMVSIRNPDTGLVERSLCRMQLRGRDGLGLAFLTAPFYDLLPRFTELANAGTPPRVAVTLGFEPVTLLSATLGPRAGVDKLAMAGGVRGEPVDVLVAPLSQARGARTGRVPDRGSARGPRRVRRPDG